MREIEMFVEQARRMIADAWTDRNDPEKDHRYTQQWAGQNIQRIEKMIAFVNLLGFSATLVREALLYRGRYESSLGAIVAGFPPSISTFSLV